MALYHYQAFSKQGKRITGSLDASSKKHAQDQLVSQNLFPVKITPASQISLSGFSLKSLFERSVSIKEKLFFTKQLGILLKSGVPLLEALDLLTEQSEKKLKSILITLRDGIKEGKSLADGLAFFPKTFETIYVQLVRAGEASGKLDVILDRLTSYLERRDELRKKIKGAMTYPLIQLGVIGVVVIILLTFVVPQLAVTFSQQGAELPLPTRILMGISDFMTSYYVFLGVGFTVLYLGYRFWKSTPSGGRMIDAIKLHLPLVKYFARTTAVVQFSSTLGMLIEGGVSLPEALDIVCNIVDNRVLVEALMDARENIIKQGKIAEYLKQTGIFPPIAIYLINTGEQSGQLDTMLITVSNVYERDLVELSDGLAAKINPIMMLFMAVVVGFIVISIVLPLTDMGSALGSDGGGAGELGL